MEISQLIEHYGYAVIFLGTLLEGETWVALGGFAAYQGYLHLSVLIPVAIVGAIIGDQAFFLLGRKKGKEYLDRRLHLKERVAGVHDLLERHQDLLMFGSRFMYGFRAVLPVAFGMSNVSQKRFFVFNVMGAVLWGVVFGYGGYALGGTMSVIIGDLKKIEIFIVVTAITVFFVIQGIAWRRRRKYVDNLQ